MAEKVNSTEALVTNDNPAFRGYDCPNGTMAHRNGSWAFVPNILPPQVSYDPETVSLPTDLPLDKHKSSHHGPHSGRKNRADLRMQVQSGSTLAPARAPSADVFRWAVTDTGDVLASKTLV